MGPAAADSVVLLCGIGADRVALSGELAAEKFLGCDRSMRIVLAADHAGFGLKAVVGTHLRSGGHQIEDLGTFSMDPIDYPPICARCARRVVEGGVDLGIVIGGSGQGEAMAANKVRGARAALCHDEYTARLARRHNDANLLSLGARIVAAELALDIVDVFMATAFAGGRHQRRVEQLAMIEVTEAGAIVGAFESGGVTSTDADETVDLDPNM